jgi:hypothetical protein
MPICLGSAAGVILMGHPVIGTLYLCILGAYIALCCKSWSIGRRAGYGLAASAAVAALSAVVILPFLVNFSRYSSYKTNWDGGPYHQWWTLSDPASTVYIPMPVLALALVGAFIKGDRRRWFFIGLVAYGYLTMAPWFTSGIIRWALSLGGNLVAMYGQEAVWLGMGWLAIRGVQVLEEGSPGLRAPSLRFLLYGTAAYYILSWFSSDHEFQSFLASRHLLLALFELACLAGVIAYCAASRLTLRKFARGWSVLTLATVAWFLPLRPSDLFSDADLSRNPPDVVRTILAEGGGTGRWRMTAEYLVRPDGYADLTPNQPEQWGLWDIRTTNPLILANFAEFSLRWQSGFFFIARWFPSQSEELLRFLGVRWVVQDSIRPVIPGIGWRKPCPLGVRQVEGAVPWVRALGCWEAIASPERQMSSTFRLIESGGWRSKVILDRPADLVRADGVGWVPPAIQWVETGPNRWRWRVGGPSASLLAVLQNAHPNWAASVDGAEVPVLGAYGCFQAVVVPAGDHLVEMRYDEPWFWRGVAVSALAWLGLLLAAAVGFRRRRGRMPA